MKRRKRVAALQGQTWPDRDTPPPALNPRVRYRLGEADLDALVAAYEAGATGRQLATQFGLARSTVILLLKQRGIVVRHPRLTSDEIAEIVRWFQSGVTQAEIGRRIGRDKGHVWHVLRRQGVL